MKKLITLTTLLLLVATFAVAQTNGKLLITAKLSGDQEVPAVSTNASGVAGLLLNENRDSLFINITVAKLSGPITGIHIHEGARGTNGGVKTNLTTSINGSLISTVITGATLTSEMIEGLITGKYYLNVHTAANANGEIRGQLELEADWGFFGMLEGSQEVPPVSTSATGWVVTSLSKNKEMVHVWAVVRGLSGPITAAHFHKAAAGVNGGVEANLTPNISGNTITASLPAATFANDLIAGNIYLNIHTAANPNGELRGQMMWSDKLNFISSIDGAQEVPATSAVGKGVALIRVNAAMDSLWYDILVDSISGAITGAHLHDGAKGVNGGVLVNLSSGISGNMISGTATGVAKADLIKMMKGNVYINIHTAANANGEVRGQVMSLTRTGYTALINGLQEVPTVVTTAMGSGIVSVDAMETNAHYMFVVNGLSGDITGAHFHNAAAGANGGVVHNISTSFSQSGTSDAAFNYWTMGFTATNAKQFRDGEIYVNIHTAANANGEIRGQVSDQGFTVPNSTGIFTPTSVKSITAYPNPAINTIYLQFDETSNGNATIKVLDIQGKTVLTQTTDLTTNNQVTLGVSGLEKGVYMVNIETLEGVRVAKFIKQ
jgi:hypothetical protein